jgi:hypothetical protein
LKDQEQKKLEDLKKQKEDAIQELRNKDLVSANSRKILENFGVFAGKP